jgi:hypothetical protein
MGIRTAFFKEWVDGDGQKKCTQIVPLYLLLRCRRDERPFELPHEEKVRSIYMSI